MKGLPEREAISEEKMAFISFIKNRQRERQDTVTEKTVFLASAFTLNTCSFY